MSRERELLERALRLLNDRLHEEVQLRDEICVYLAEPKKSETLPKWRSGEIIDFSNSKNQDQPEPVAWLYSKGDVLAGVPVVFTSATIGKEVAHQEPHYDQKPLYLHPAPRKPFVRLSEDEVNTIMNRPLMTTYRVLQEVENLLEKKNQ